jgi:hypothetical protein
MRGKQPTFRDKYYFFNRALEQDIRKHCVSLSVVVYYGAVKKRKEMHLTLHTYDIALTSYGVNIILTKYIVFT